MLFTYLNPVLAMLSTPYIVQKLPVHSTTFLWNSANPGYDVIMMPRFCCETRTIVVRSLLANVKEGMSVPPNASIFSTEKFGHAAPTCSCSFHTSAGIRNLGSKRISYEASERGAFGKFSAKSSAENCAFSRTAIDSPQLEQLSSLPRIGVCDEGHIPACEKARENALRTTNYKAFAIEDATGDRAATLTKSANRPYAVA